MTTTICGRWDFYHGKQLQKWIYGVNRNEWHNFYLFLDQPKGYWSPKIVHRACISRHIHGFGTISMSPSRINTLNWQEMFHIFIPYLSPWHSWKMSLNINDPLNLFSAVSVVKTNETNKSTTVCMAYVWSPGWVIPIKNASFNCFNWKNLFPTYHLYFKAVICGSRHVIMWSP